MAQPVLDGLEEAGEGVERGVGDVGCKFSIAARHQGQKRNVIWETRVILRLAEAVEEKVAQASSVDAGEQGVRLLRYQVVRYLELVVKEVESLQQFFVVCKKSESTHAVSRSQVGWVSVGGREQKSMIIQLE